MFSIAVEVEPNPDIHVYAPGAEAMGYRVVSLNLRPVPHVRFEPVEFPASEIYHFEPLDERVPVYQRIAPTNKITPSKNRIPITLNAEPSLSSAVMRWSMEERSEALYQRLLWKSH